ncbi:MAG: PKD domain-containing protein [Chitinophagaceae bacterium]|jgi:hypothetical protein
MKKTLTLYAVLMATLCFGKGQKKSVLFIGNSYTYTNDLPKMLADLALSAGDTVIFDSYSPGGFTFEQHSTDPTTLGKIDMGTWDYVVLQEQSQRPAFPIAQVESEVFPYAKILNDRVRAKNPCGETIFYMTWGRKNGDADNCPFYPPICTFSGMNDELRARYEIMADRNDAMLSPVGAIWKSVRTANPALELYVPDESHPSVAGTYIAACSFYTTIFQNDASTTTFNPGLAAADANSIKSATKKILFDSLSKWKIGENDPTANFNFTVPTGSKTASFANTSIAATSYRWDFGDAGTSTSTTPSHTYAANGSYTVTLVAKFCNRTDTMRKVVNIGPTGIDENNTVKTNLQAYPNPFRHSMSLDLTSLKADAEIKVYNYMGVLVFQQKASPAIINADLSKLPAGNYILKVTSTEEVVLMQKIIKQD